MPPPQSLWLCTNSAPAHTRARTSLRDQQTARAGARHAARDTGRHRETMPVLIPTPTAGSMRPARGQACCHRQHGGANAPGLPPWRPAAANAGALRVPRPAPYHPNMDAQVCGDMFGELKRIAPPSK